VAPIVDGNVERVFSRVFALEEIAGTTAFSKRAWELAERLVPSRDAGEHNQALMELGARVCRPSDPKCHACPLEPCCGARRANAAASYPKRKPKAAPVSVRHACAAVVRQGKALLARRADTGLWAGLWELPRLECGANEDAKVVCLRALREIAGIEGAAPEPLATVRHQVMHFRVRLDGYRVRFQSGQASAIGCSETGWFSEDEAMLLALSSPQREMLALLFASVSPREKSLAGA
jgi:A/G-specific adenine glycosylase